MAAAIDVNLPIRPSDRFKQKHLISDEVIYNEGINAIVDKKEGTKMIWATARVADFPGENIQPYNTLILESKLTSFANLIVSPEQNDDRNIVCKTTNEIEFILACLDKNNAADYLSITREMGHIYFKCEKRQDHYEMVHLYRKQQEAEAAASGSLD